MALTYVAQSIRPNHDYAFSVSPQGVITAMVVRAEVNYGSMGRMEQLDIWPLLSPAQKQAVQGAYNQIAQLFSQAFL